MNVTRKCAAATLVGLLSASLWAADPVSGPPENLRIDVGIEAPGGNYTMKITGVYQVGEEIWVTSQVGTTGGVGITVITNIGDSVLVDFDDVPLGAMVKHKVVGKTWNWGKATDDLAYVPQSEEAKLKKRLAKATKIAFRPLNALPDPNREGARK